MRPGSFTYPPESDVDVACHSVRAIRRVETLMLETLYGKGTDDDPARLVHSYWIEQSDGWVLIGVSDPWFTESLRLKGSAE